MKIRILGSGYADWERYILFSGEIKMNKDPGNNTIYWTENSDISAIEPSENILDTSPRWFAVHVRSRHEKLVSEELESKNISHYLPLLEKRKKWSDRWKLVHEPLFPNYLFVNISSDRRINVLDTRGVVQIVGAGDKPWPIPEQEIAAIRQAIECNLKCDPYPYLKCGTEVYVIHGPLKGYHGILIEKDKKHRLVLSIHLLNQSMSVEINATDVKPV